MRLRWHVGGTRVALLAALLVALLTGALHEATAQPSARTAQRRLGPPIATVADEFVHVGDVVELPDGRVLITETREYRLVLADVARGVARTLGRTGAGPDEYRWIDGLYRRPEGGAYLLDPALRRLLPITAQGTFETPVAVPAGLMLRGVSDDGAVYGEKFFPRRASGMADSMYIVRWRPGQTRIDTVIAYDAGVSKSVGAGALAAFPALDFWTVLPRGEVVHLNAERYAISFVRAGKLVAARTIPYDPVRFTRQDAAAFARIHDQQPPMRIGQSRGASAPTERPERTFPDVLPPFGGEGLGGRYAFPTRHGTIWVARLSAPSDSLRRYDVLDDRSGSLLGTLLLDAGSRVVGFGASRVYVVTPDTDGIERVSQHVLPQFDAVR